jgi:hypothetical protein
VPCDKFAEDLPGCKSFNEMLAAQDKDVLRSLAGSDQAYVCFRTGEDVFTIVSFEKTDDLYSFKKTATSIAETSGFPTLTRYKEGVSEDYQPFWGKWRKLASASNETAHFIGGGSALRPFRVSIDNSEVSVSYQWKNVSNTITTYTLQIRRSTKRGLETLEAPPPPTDKNKSVSQTTFQDFCEFYPN